MRRRTHNRKVGRRSALPPWTATGSEESRMASLKGSKTEDNLKAAFAGESQANRRYLYFAQKADVEGYNDVSAVFPPARRGQTRPRAGPSRISRGTRRPGARPADRRDLEQSEGGSRRRDT